MVYVIRKANGTIKSYSEKDDDVLLNGETREMFDGLMADYAGRFRLLTNKTSIIANGVDQAIVTITTNTAAQSIEVLINDFSATVPITDGQGNLPPITAETGGVIIIEPADQTRYCAAGNGRLVIEAMEE